MLQLIICPPAAAAACPHPTPPPFQVWQKALPRRYSLKASFAIDPDTGKATTSIVGLCKGSEAECRAGIEDGLPTSGPLAGELNFTYDEGTYLKHAVNGIGWPLPNGLTELEALATPSAWAPERSYYK